MVSLPLLEPPAALQRRLRWMVGPGSVAGEVLGGWPRVLEPRRLRTDELEEMIQIWVNSSSLLADFKGKTRGQRTVLRPP